MDLSGISGIGQARARWLEDAMGVRTLRDLAALSPEDVERRLKRARGNKPPRSTIDAWVAEAKAHLADDGSEVEPSVPARTKSRRAETWKPVASFVVEFQSRIGSEASDTPVARRRTAAHHVEEDRDEAWPGWDFGALGRWMAAQLPMRPGSDGGEEVVRVEEADASEPTETGEDQGDPARCASDRRRRVDGLEPRSDRRTMDGDVHVASRRARRSISRGRVVARSLPHTCRSRGPTAGLGGIDQGARHRSRTRTRLPVPPRRAGEHRHAGTHRSRLPRVCDRHVRFGRGRSRHPVGIHGPRDRPLL